MNKCWRLVWMLLFLALPLAAQIQPKVTVKKLLEQEEQTQHEDSQKAPIESWDKLGRETPKSAMIGFLNAIHRFDYELAAQFLDYRNLPFEVTESQKAQLTKQLHIALDRALWIDVESLSPSPEGQENDNVPSYRDLVGTITTPTGNIAILLQRVPSDVAGKRIWKISNATVAQIPVLDDYYRYNQFAQWLSDAFPKHSFMGIMLWQWLYFLINFIGYLLVAWASFWLFARLIGAIGKTKLSALVVGLQNPLTLLCAVIISRSVSDLSSMTLAAKAVSEGATLLIIAWTWLLWRLVDVVNAFISERLIANDKSHGIYILRPASNVIKTLLVVIATFIWLENLGFNASTMLAGLGIGGLAVALAAQKSVENLIGAITLYSSSPVKVGNFCKVGQLLGTVEEIGLRATRIRTLERTVVYIANAKFVDMEIENFSEREKIAFKPTLVVQNPEDSAKLSAFCDALKAALIAHELIDGSPVRVFVKGFSPYAVEIYVLAYVNSTALETYLSVNEQLHLTIISLLHQHQLKLAQPEPLVGA